MPRPLKPIDSALSLVKTAKVEDMFVDCLHPYTKALLAAVPIPDIVDRGPVSC